MIVFFFFKQKTAYEMRISDWSSDVCSSDLLLDVARGLNPLGGNGFRTDDGNRDRDRLEALLTAAGCHDDFIRIRAIGGCGTGVISPTAARARLGKGVRRCESQYGRN